ncbi:hypothetical protein ACWDKQ_35520, partial [Saccharopolyspora sp. NPDC000995]
MITAERGVLGRDQRHHILQRHRSILTSQQPGVMRAVHNPLRCTTELPRSTGVVRLRRLRVSPQAIKPLQQLCPFLLAEDALGVVGVIGLRITRDSLSGLRPRVPTRGRPRTRTHDHRRERQIMQSP